MPRIITAAERGNNKLLLSFAVVVASAKAAPAEAMDSGLALFRDVFQGLLELLKFTHVYGEEGLRSLRSSSECCSLSSVAVAVCIYQHLRAKRTEVSKLETKRFTSGIRGTYIKSKRVSNY